MPSLEAANISPGELIPASVGPKPQIVNKGNDSLVIVHWETRLVPTSWHHRENEPGDAWARAARLCFHPPTQRLRMGVVTTVLGSGFVGEDFVERHVIGADAIDAVGNTNNQWSPQVTNERADRDVHHVI